MASLRTQPGSCTADQRKTLMIAARAHGLDVQAVRDAAGVERLHELSAAQASALIEKYSGRGLPNPPGKKPRPYFRKKPGAQITRMITDDHCEQITRLSLWYFDGSEDAARQWFIKNWKVNEPWQLQTADRAGQVIAVLKEMCERKSA